MNKIIAAVACCLLMFMADVSLAKEWRGIIPLHSTRADVIRLLGEPTHDGDSYEMSEGRVSILYAGQPCERRFGVERWNVPADTVLEITVVLKKVLSVKDLHLDLGGFKKEPADYGQGSYRNDEEGISYNLWMTHLVGSITYGPTRNDAHLSCKEEGKVLK